MRCRSLAIVLLVGGLLPWLVAEDAAVQRQKLETISKADKLFGQRYTPVAGKPLRLFDKQTETGPRDEVIYWHGSIYVIELIFAADGSVAGLVLQPEALLHSDSWTAVPRAVELAPAEMQWLLESASELKPLGKAGAVMNAPNGCVQSGRNLYCFDQYDLAIVSHYHTERLRENNRVEVSLRDIAILYKQSVVGFVEDTRVHGSQRQLKIAGHWYHGEKPGMEIFSDASIGFPVHLVTYGCTANQNACLATSEQVKPATAEH